LLTRKLILIIVLFSCITLSCTGADNTLLSKDYSNNDKINLIKQKIETKSPIEWTEFKLFDVNTNSRSIPGPSNKDYKIVLKVNPQYIDLWIKDKQKLITSYPHKNNWINEVLSQKQLSEIKEIGYMTYYKKEAGYEYTLWVNNEHGIIIIRFIQS